MSQWIKLGCLGVWLFGIASNAWAGVIVGGTRVVYNSEKREASISVKNPEKSIPYLIQSWVESENVSTVMKAPFIITPPLFRLDAEQENTLRIVRIDGQLPSNKETVYWLNIKSIPATERAEQNTLQISVKTRIKMFYRPAGLSGNASEAYKFQRFTKNGNQLRVDNPTPYYVSFYSIKIGANEIEEAGMVAPYSTRDWITPEGATGSISWQAINDYGGISEVAHTSP